LIGNCFAESVLGTKLTQSALLHSHLERQHVSADELKNQVRSKAVVFFFKLIKSLVQVSFGYGHLGKWESQIPIDGPFAKEEDPTRLVYVLQAQSDHSSVLFCGLFSDLSHITAC
jgi:hypothetical protein